MTMRLLMKLEPHKVGNYHEMVTVSTKTKPDTEYYPNFMVHVDTFYVGRGENNSIHDALTQGETVYIDAHLAKMTVQD